MKPRYFGVDLKTSRAPLLNDPEEALVIGVVIGLIFGIIFGVLIHG